MVASRKPVGINFLSRWDGDTVETTGRITTLLHDTQYRTALASQNTAYNQLPHPSFFIGDRMATPPRPTVRTP
ncbi:hypothetical protein GCM10010276_03230 [Streptomyces longisporus]|uniref:Rhamnogalacturonan lyase family 11 C-terminal domain-containing protein n=1 Tax=Streptomyces longisporus TaxID=1948 RepID=A0ABP5XZU8_STRLO